jgi:hypothetical protein
MRDFLRGKSHAVRRLHQHLQEIRVRTTPIAKLLSFANNETHHFATNEVQLLSLAVA